MEQNSTMPVLIRLGERYRDTQPMCLNVAYQVVWDIVLMDVLKTQVGTSHGHAMVVLVFYLW
jgi:hypothetical protein